MSSRPRFLFNLLNRCCQERSAVLSLTQSKLQLFDNSPLISLRTMLLSQAVPATTRTEDLAYDPEYSIVSKVPIHYKSIGQAEFFVAEGVWDGADDPHSDRLPEADGGRV